MSRWSEFPGPVKEAILSNISWSGKRQVGQRHAATLKRAAVGIQSVLQPSCFGEFPFTDTAHLAAQQSLQETRRPRSFLTTIKLCV